MPVYSLAGIAPELPSEGDYWIAPDAVLIGRVRLNRNASVWWGAVLRGDNDWIEVGENSNVQDHCVIHADAGEPVHIGAEVTIGHRAVIHSATIGDGSLIGMGAILLNRVRLGREVLVGAAALLTEGKCFEDGKMVLGAPARAIRDLTAEERAGLRGSARGYVANTARFREKLERA